MLSLDLGVKLFLLDFQQMKGIGKVQILNHNRHKMKICLLLML
jgi:hypothetical protein